MQGGDVIRILAQQCRAFGLRAIELAGSPQALGILDRCVSANEGISVVAWAWITNGVIP
jgi:hypothetical protein